MQPLIQMIQTANDAMASGNIDLAAQLSLEILKHAPDTPHAHYILGMAAMQKKDVKTALKSIKKAQKLLPNDAALMNSLGSAYAANDRTNEALSCFRQSTKLDPTYATAIYNTGLIYKMRLQAEEAERAFSRAVELQPGYGEALVQWGMTLQSMGQQRQANDAFLRAAETNVCSIDARSNLLLGLNYCADADPHAIIAEHRLWGSIEEQKHAAQANDQLTAVRLDAPLKRIGYLSADFRTHSVAHFFQPVLQSHDRSKYEIYCYYTDKKSDAMTAQLRQSASVWRDVATVSDEQLTQQIMADEIDILVDLSGHTHMHRLAVFARRAAPIQVTWLGYPNTTGLSRMDYRITDAVTDPAGAEQFCTEKLIQLPGGFVTFSADESITANSQCPSERHKRITFGSFNNLMKVTPEVLDLWARLLQKLPDSQLLLKSYILDRTFNKTRLIQEFEQRGIDKHRLTLMSSIKNGGKHLALYDELDVALDPFPYGGTTTTCEALWMGVPVVTLIGATHASRVGASLLHRVGLDDLVAHSPDEYCAIACALANDIVRRKSLRSELRSTLKLSNLGNAERFTRELENSFESVWQARKAAPLSIS